MVQESGEVDQDYVTYKQLHETLIELVLKELGREFSLYDLEHVFWLKGGNSVRTATLTSLRNAGTISTPNSQRNGAPSAPAYLDRTLTDDYVPPVVAIIPRLAANDPTLKDIARETGTTIDRAFEKSCNAALTVLGYDTKLLGQARVESQMVKQSRRSTPTR